MTGEQLVIAGVISVMTLFMFVLGAVALYAREPGPAESRKPRRK